MRRVLFFIETKWAFGALHYDLCKYLMARDFVADVIDWAHMYTVDQFKLIIDYYDYIITIPGQAAVLIHNYQVPHDQIIIVAHGVEDLRIALRNDPPEEFDRFAAYAVISELISRRSEELGIRRVPNIVRVGITCDKFPFPVADGLNTVGYGSTMHRLDHAGTDIKRGHLAQAAAQAAGLTFRPADRLIFLTMPQYYSYVDAVLVSSLEHHEGCALPGMEAAAAGRLVISTDAGYYPLLPEAQALDLIAPSEPAEYHEFVADKLRLYKHEARRYKEVCHVIRKAAARFDWGVAIDDWSRLISNPNMPSRRRERLPA